MMNMQDNDIIEFLDEESNPEHFTTQDIPEKFWSLLIVDDEENVHDATKFALKGIKLLGRSVKADSAFSAAEAKQLLEHKRYDCILVDVVMENESAGLVLIEHIRNIVNDHLVRIILRTGQPGYAPEMEVIEKYDINDYKCKSDLTANHLNTSLVSALRAFEQLKTIDETRQGLELIIDAASNLMQKKAVHQFAKSTLTQVCSLLKIKNDSLLFVIMADQCLDDALIIATAGQFESIHGKLISALDDPAILRDIKQTLAEKTNLYHEKSSVLYIHSPYGAELVIYLHTEKPLIDLDKRLLELFSIDIAVGFDTAWMFEKVETIAYVDLLTGLPNKIAMEQQLDKLTKHQKQLAVLLFDIDNFQTINDGLGYNVGDKVLLRAAEIIQTIFPDSALGRVSSDVFCLIMLDSPIDQIKHNLLLLKEFLRNSIKIDHYQITLSMCVGIALFPVHDKAAKLLLKKAGIALKYAKTWCRGLYQFFDQSMEDSLISRLNIISDLHHCIEKQELTLYYQPKIDIKTGKIRGVEALISWNKNGQLIFPDTFISAAESSGHIIEIGNWVLREACRQQCYWRDILGINLHIAVNVSVRQLQEATFLERLESAINDSGINPTFLELEVTESMMANNGYIIDILNSARNLGVKISIDDFGMGYSCLSALQILPVDNLKIDKSFINNMTKEDSLTKPKNTTLVELIINLAHLLGLKVIAEGVETKEQENLLLNMGCDLMQGFLYAKPILPDDLLKLIHERSWLH
jgi:diguanylate cyclase